MPRLKKPNFMQALITDASTPEEQRIELLKVLVNDSNPETRQVLNSLLQQLANSGAESVFVEKSRRLSELLQEMEESPLRPAAFVEMLPPNGTSVRHAQVVFDDGLRACTVVPDIALAETLRPGDRVLLETKGRALLRRASNGLSSGEEAQLERRLDERHVEISVRGTERHVVLAAQPLLDQLASASIEPGATLVVNTRQGLALHALPPADGHSHYRFLTRQPVPDVIVDRDIGAPPRCIAEMSAMLQMEMTRPELRRRYGLRRCQMKLLCGVSGSGKTLAVQAIWRRMYEIMSDLTGTPVPELPPRVLHLNLSQVLSMWLGESDKNLDRFFSETEQLAAEPFVSSDGTSHTLPVLAILEEIDGLARARGHEPVYDRIMTTALQRLDPGRENLKDKLILFVGTTNEPQHVDRAFIRRIGGTIEHFGRLKEKAFRAVLRKHLQKLPLSSRREVTGAEDLAATVNEVSAWLFSPNGDDRGLVELTYAGSTTPDVRFRRDFLTGALVDRAVQQAAETACQAEADRLGDGGVSFELLARSFDRQLRAVADQLNEHNAGHYLDLPDGRRVAQLRRIPQPALLPVTLQRIPA